MFFASTLFGSKRFLAAGGLAFTALTGVHAAEPIDLSKLPPAATRQVDFVKDIQPIFKEHCYSCHGELKQKASLRWDVKQVALKGGERGVEFVAGKSAESRMIQAVAAIDPEFVMPEKGERLTKDQVGILRAWIDQGAVWPDGVDLVKYIDKKDHWSFKAPVRPTPPVTKSWGRNPIDAFIFAKLQAQKLKPSPEADKVTLIRRLSLDLVGLPPTLKEIDQFLADKSPDAYDKLVDRLLSSPHYGEKWGRHWLDAARYADTNGYEKDLPRTMWPYRDWVINAMNSDMPFDEFTIEQLAGDLLPKATLQQKVATGFLRNSMINEEGGVDPEQFRIEGLIDRMDTLGKSFLGLTVNCCQCHNHKFDPITQKEYFQLFAFLNNDDEPEMEVPDAEQQGRRDAINRKIAKMVDESMAKLPDLKEKMSAWEQKMRDIDYTWDVLDPEDYYGGVGTKFEKEKDKSLLALASNPPISTYSVHCKTTLTNITGFRLEVMADPNLPNAGPGRSPNGNFVLTEISAEAVSLKDPTKTNKIVFTNATADFSQAGFPVASAIDGTGTNKIGWAGEDLPGKRNRSHVAVFELKDGLGFEGGTDIKFEMIQSFGGQHAMGRFRISAITNKRSLLADPLSKEQRGLLATTKRTTEETRELFDAYRRVDERLADANKQMDEEQKKWPMVPKTLVLLAREDARETHIFKRGDFKKPLDAVQPGTPSFLPPIPQGEKTNRLTLAKWIVDQKNPLTARVIMNRFWMHYFGQGLVTTPEDFGTRCDAPSHPELLDWMATEFMQRNWSMKAMHKLIVTSATYRQSSKVAPDVFAVDQYNRWLERGARVRVDAEEIRDIALRVSGLLNVKIGGPSVYPVIPDGVLSLAYGAPSWPTSEGADLYRRGLYTFWKRSAPYPSQAIFDQTSGEASCVRRVRSNTPLQALTTLNDASFHECSRALAMRIWKEGGSNDRDRATYGFRLCTGRSPDKAELENLLAMLRDSKTYFENDTVHAIKVALEDKDKIPEKINVHQVAELTMLARVLLNLDETITKE
ncbi:MAG: putative rane protein [Verrucomicrobiales bacterium]|nr:putative rane protein [Verrucomicrobiales bacterium]